MTEVWNTCKITGKSFSSARGFANHLRCVGMSTKEYYDKFHKKEDEGQCQVCGKETTYHGFKYKLYCSDVCAMKSDSHREAVSQRFINNPEALKSFRSKRKGVSNDPNLSKRRNTLAKQATERGVSLDEYYSMMVRETRKPRSKEQIVEATKKQMETKQSTGKIGGRSGYKLYPFFDEFVSLQGYEPVVLKTLIEEYGFSKEEICVGKGRIPIIPYGKKKLYFPDFYLPKLNLLIEVKSKFTLKQHHDNVMEKCQASINNGYSVVLLVVDIKEVRKNKLDGSKKLLDWAISSQDPNPLWYGYGSTTIPSGSRD